MPIKSFRGQLAHDQEETIRLSTNQGLIGYKINKFEVIPANPATTSQESIVKIFTQPNQTIQEDILFDDPLLMAVAWAENNSSAAYFGGDTIIFDNTTINQNLFINHWEGGSAQPINYHLELEQVKLSKDEAAVATLKDMRGSS